MAEFTMQLKKVVETIYSTSLENYDWDQPYASVAYKGITYGKLPTVSDWDLIGLGYYPIFDETYRAVLNGKIIDNFFLREIGMETIDTWIWLVRTRMNNIMPYYNKLYESELIEYSALDTMNIQTHRNDATTENNTSTGHSNATSGVNSLARVVSSQTPATMLSGDEDYASGATDSNSQTNSTNTGDNTATSNNAGTLTGDTNVTGYQAAASDLITKFRGTLLNIDMMIMNNLEDCFMGILNSSDDYFNRNGWAY